MEKVKLLDVCDVYQPKTISAKDFVADGQYLVYGANGAIGTYTEYNHAEPEVLMACRGATCGAINVSAPFSWINGNAMVIHPNGVRELSKKYLMYFLTFVKKDGIITGTAQPQITRQNLKNFYISICDLTEQERIVARIEELFSQLDNGVETLKKTKQQLTVYRQAVLKDAFSGSLTNAKMVSEQPLDHYIEKPRYGTSKKCSYDVSDESIPVYRIPNINHIAGRIDHCDIKYATFLPQEIEGITLQEDDILIIRSNGSVALVGRAAIVSAQDTTGTFAGYLMRLRIKNRLQLVPKYLFWYLQSYPARTYIESKAKSTSGVHNINSTEISNLNVPIYSLDEQFAIIEAIESRFSVCDSIEQTIDTALQQAEALRQSILKRAFEGGL